MKKLLVFIPFAFLLIGCTHRPTVSVDVPAPKEDAAKLPPAASQPTVDTEDIAPGTVRRIDFSEYNPVFRFSAALPENTDVEYVPEIDAINIYGPVMAAASPRALSQIFIRYFSANDFLTLSTVDILKRESTSVKGHDAVRYEIKKKEGVPPFPNQPSWRNGEHQLIDIRFAKTNPSEFYVFAYNPNFAPNEFEKFVESIRFHNDRESFVEPLFNTSKRITKKPFGIKISPADSPVSPERFSGYHTGVDYEIFDDEKEKNVPVFAICGGELLQKKNAGGYGGVVVQECVLDDQVLTVVYGHIALSSVIRTVGDYVDPGEQIASLGAGFSADTDNERKHLHLGIHKGTSINLRGYVDNLEELQNWLDFASF